MGLHRLIVRGCCCCCKLFNRRANCSSSADCCSSVDCAMSRSSGDCKSASDDEPPRVGAPSSSECKRDVVVVTFSMVTILVHYNILLVPCNFCRVVSTLSTFCFTFFLRLSRSVVFVRNAGHGIRDG